MARDIIEKSDESSSALSVNGHIYDLQSVPDYNDPLVLKQKQNLLLQIDLNDLNDNLFLSIELLYVAYNGVAGAKGGEIQSEINLLMGDFAILCNKCIGTMNTFKSETDYIIDLLGQTYRFLLGGKEKMAILKLKHCGGASTAMAAKADELSEEFKALQKRSAVIRSTTILEEASENDKKEAAQKAIRELQASQKAETTNQAELVEQAGQVQVMYDDAKQREEKASEKSLILGITSAICGAIGAGLGAYAATKNPIGSAMAASTSQADKDKIELAQKTADSKKEKSDEANKNLLGVKNKLIPAKSKLATLKKEETEIGTEITILEGVDEATRSDGQKEELSALKTKLAAKTKEITEADVATKKLEGEVKTLEKSATDYTAEYGAASAALNKLSGSMDTMAASAASAEESIHQEKMKFLEKKFELETQKRKSLVAMAEFAEGIKNAKVEEGNAEVSVTSLHAAVAAMGKIIGTLTDASLFWKQMADFCSNMSNKGFQTNIKDLSDPDSGFTVAERVEEYQNPHFMMSFLEYLCQWVALNGVSGEYVISAGKAQKKCTENIAKSPTIEEARRKAPELAKAMGIMLSKKILASTAQSSEILQEQARLEA